MSDTNLAQATGGDEALSVDSGADAISDLLKDPATDLTEEDRGPSDETEDAQGSEEQPEETAEEESSEEVAEDDDGPQEESDGGRFVADTGKVRLKDGSVISVQDLKRGFTSQQSFTRGTQENAKERETLASRKSEVEQYAQVLQQQRDFLLNVSHQFLPTPPDESLLDANSPSYDPLRYVGQKAEYEKKVGTVTQLQHLTQAEQARLTKMQEQQKQELRGKEAQSLVEAMPELKKPDVYRKFWDEAVDTMSEYGFTPDEMNDAIDHRLYKIYRDLAAYRRARAKLPTVKDTVQTRPMLQGKRRMDVKEKSSREKQVRQEQLRKTGTFEAGINALMDLDL